MKTKIFSFLAACLVSAGVCADDFSGKITHVESGSVIVIANDLVTRRMVQCDTIKLNQDRFSVALPNRALQVFVMPLPKNNAMPMLMMNARNTYLYFPGDKLQLNGSFGALTPSGTKLYDEMATCAAWKELQAREDSLNAHVMADFRKKQANPNYKSTVEQEVKAYKDFKLQVCKKLVAEKPKSLMTAYAVCQLEPAEAVPLIARLDASVQQGVFKPLLDNIKLAHDMSLKRAEAQKSLGAGKQAPDFRLRDINGTERTLADFKGKYVVLDFWGTWCGWCIKGIPQMKEYYNKYKDRMEIVGICCNDTDEKWRDGVAKHQLPWTNLYNGFDKDIVTRYAVSGFPTKVLIDPEGKLVQIFIGESEEMYQKLDNLFTN